MKKIILLAVAAAGVFTLAASAQAGDALMSPRAQAQADSLKKVSGTTPNLIDHTVLAGTPKSMGQSSGGVAGAANDVDLAHAPRPNMSVKDPGYEAAWRANAYSQQIQVAPLK